MRDIIFLSIIIVVAITIPFVLNKTNPIDMLEGFSNNSLEPASVNEKNALVQDVYPSTGNTQISENNSSDIWWHYPIFKLGSYAQLTNNLKYSDSPDIGNCAPASMCGTLYYNKHLGSNYVKPLPQLNPLCGTRVGYFNTYDNLLSFKNNMQNILY